MNRANATNTVCSLIHHDIEKISRIMGEDYTSLQTLANHELATLTKKHLPYSASDMEDLIQKIQFIKCLLSKPHFALSNQLAHLQTLHTSIEEAIKLLENEPSEINEQPKKFVHIHQVHVLPSVNLTQQQEQTSSQPLPKEPQTDSESDLLIQCMKSSGLQAFVTQ